MALHSVSFRRVTHIWLITNAADLEGSTKLDVRARRMEAGKGTAAGKLMPWITKAYLVRGFTPQTTCRIIKKQRDSISKWMYVDMRQVTQLLGHALVPLVTLNWGKTSKQTTQNTV